MPDRDVHAALDELRELHGHWALELGPDEATRRFRRQVRQYPLRLLIASLASLGRHGSWASPRAALLSARSLARAPGLTAAIVLTVGVGIGGCATVFAVVDTLFLRPLPYPHPDRLVWIYTDSPPNRWPFSVVDLQALTEQQTSFQAVAAYARNARTFLTTEGARRLTTVDPTPGFFDLLGIQLLSGRAATTAEGAPGAAATTLVTVDFASRELGSVHPDGSDALGAAVRLDGELHRVIGILPSSFGPLAADAEVFPTLRLHPPARKGPFFLRVFGRVRDDVAPRQAEAELRAINQRLFPLWADSYQDDRASWGLLDLSTTLRRDAGRLLAILMAAVGMLLLVAAANATSLLLARVTARHRELAVRRALGASRTQVNGHLLVESAILACGGVAVGLVFAWGGIGILPAVAGEYLPRLAEARLSVAVGGFSLALSAACGILFALVPAFHGGGGVAMGAAFPSGGRSSASARDLRLQRLLVVGQISLVVPLLASAGLLLTSFVKLQSTDPGFTPDNLVSMRISPSEEAFPDPAARGQLWSALLERISGHPGVVAVGVANGRPPLENSGTNNFDLEDRPTPTGQSQPSVPWILAEPGYFETLGVPLLAGRGFEDLDREYSPEVAIVDEAWAERFFPGEEAVGRRFKSGGCTTCDWTTVIGVVGAVPYTGLDGATAGAVYQPDPLRFSSEPFLFVRTRREPEQIVETVRRELLRIEPSTTLTQVETGRSLLEGSLAEPRHLTLLLATFSAVALALAIVGLYGITAHSVQRRRGELAVRMALGGSPSSLLRMVLRQGLALAVTGLGMGLLLALGMTGGLATLLHDVSPRDPRILIGVAALLLLVAAAACLVPGWRALRLDPSVALREE
jgi:putative ABC transport system permease protein